MLCLFGICISQRFGDIGKRNCKFCSRKLRYRHFLLQIFESDENNCTLRKLLLLGCHCITNGFTIYKKRFLLRSIFFKGTVSQDFVFFLFDQKNSRTRAPLWTGKNGFANFLIFSKIFAKNVCPHSCWLRRQCVSVVINHADTPQIILLWKIKQKLTIKVT